MVAVVSQCFHHRLNRRVSNLFPVSWVVMLNHLYSNSLPRSASLWLQRCMSFSETRIGVLVVSSFLVCHCHPSTPTTKRWLLICVQVSSASRSMLSTQSDWVSWQVHPQQNSATSCILKGCRSSQVHYFVCCVNLPSINLTVPPSISDRSSNNRQP